ncbi:hypothetical protein [Lysobacter sp. Hz 25]|uniref:hypothetical protein n=1 Tax=Lysobacter sp. Hz 25 TaxID=3383698 RepID=UPI0038D379A0
MAWKNAFAIGACTVEVWSNAITGDFHLIPPGEYGEYGISVEVSTAGVVTMTAPNIGGSGFNYEVRIVPSYPTQGRAVRLAVAENPEESPDYRYPNWSGDPVVIDPDVGWETPFLFTPKGPWIWAGYRSGRTGV